MSKAYSYTIYTKSSGEIRKCVSASEEDIVHMYDAHTENIIPGFYDPGTYKIEGGEGVLLVETEDWDFFNRDKRNYELSMSDWTQVPDSPLSNTKKAEWATYRQALRNLPNHSNWPNLEDADWPTPPS